MNNKSIFIFWVTIPSYIPPKGVGCDLKSDDKSGFLNHLFLKFGRPSDQIGCILWIRRDTICNLVFSQLTFPGCLFLSLPLQRGLPWIKCSYCFSLWFRFKPRVCVYRTMTVVTAAWSTSGAPSWKPVSSAQSQELMGLKLISTSSVSLHFRLISNR